MNVELLKQEDELRWDEFVLQAKGAAFCHLLGWRNVIKKSYGHQDLYLVAKEGGDIKGILPAFLIKNLFFGKKIISLPFLGYGGIVSESEAAKELLIEYLKDYTGKNKYDFFELRSLTPAADLSVNLSYSTLILPLDCNENTMWEKLDKKVRNQIKKTDRFNFQLVVGNQHLPAFYELYQRNMRRLGTPVHGWNFFLSVIEEFPNQVKLFLATVEDFPAAALFLFNFKETASNLWAAWDSRYLPMNPNDYLYWETIKFISKSGLKYFDFGRSSKESGTFHFKKQWGAEPIRLYYQYHSPTGKKIVSDKEKYGRIARAWKLLPLFITNKIGPELRKFVP